MKTGMDKDQDKKKEELIKGITVKDKLEEETVKTDKKLKKETKKKEVKADKKVVAKKVTKAKKK